MNYSIREGEKMLINMWVDNVDLSFKGGEHIEETISMLKNISNGNPLSRTELTLAEKYTKNGWLWAEDDEVIQMMDLLNVVIAVNKYTPGSPNLIQKRRINLPHVNF